jgi:hypothetical protein
MRHLSLVLGALALLSPPLLRGQTIARPGPAHGPVSASLRHPITETPAARWARLTAADTVARRIPPTYWVEGGAIGAVIAGVGVASLAHGLCRDSDAAEKSNCALALLGGSMLGGAVGFGVGALVGGLFPKHPGRAPATP